MSQSNINWMRFLPSDFVLSVATLGPLGMWGRAPGTLGSFVGLVWYTIMFHTADFMSYLFMLIFSVFFGIAFCGEAEIRLRKSDPGEIILDEFLAIPFCFIGLFNRMQIYPMWIVIVLGFVLFRFFDIFKPCGIKRLQNLHGGLGVMVDDVAAGLATCVCLHLLFFSLEQLGWAEHFMALT